VTVRGERAHRIEHRRPQIGERTEPQVGRQPPTVSLRGRGAWRVAAQRAVRFPGRYIPAWLIVNTAWLPSAARHEGGDSAVGAACPGGGCGSLDAGAGGSCLPQNASHDGSAAGGIRVRRIDDPPAVSMSHRLRSRQRKGQRWRYRHPYGKGRDSARRGTVAVPGPPGIPNPPCSTGVGLPDFVVADTARGCAANTR
jgi:hypothetical protein